MTYIATKITRASDFDPFRDIEKKEEIIIIIKKEKVRDEKD